MAAILKVFLYQRRERIDDLCPTCFLPSLIRITLAVLSDTGVTAHVRTHCVHCDRDA